MAYSSDDTILREQRAKSCKICQRLAPNRCKRHWKYTTITHTKMYTHSEVINIIESSKPKKKNLAKKQVYNHYQGRPCSFLGYEENPEQKGFNSGIDQYEANLRKQLK